MWSLGLEVFLKILGVTLDWYRASNDTKAAYLAMINAVKNDGLISVKAHDEFQKQKEKLEKEKNV